MKKFIIFLIAICLSAGVWGQTDDNIQLKNIEAVPFAPEQEKELMAVLDTTMTYNHMYHVASVTLSFPDDGSIALLSKDILTGEMHIDKASEYDSYVDEKGDFHFLFWNQGHSLIITIFPDDEVMLLVIDEKYITGLNIVKVGD
jgi:hypothetical protein